MYHFSFKVVDARIDARPGNSKLVFSSFRLRASSFDTSFNNDKPDSTLSVSFLCTCFCIHCLFLSAQLSTQAGAVQARSKTPQPRAI